MIIPPNAKTVTWSVDIGNGYDFKAAHPYPITWFGSLALIYNPDEIVLNNGEVTLAIMKLAIFE